VRITVGSSAQNARLIETLETVLLNVGARRTATAGV
jgi:histidinol-phosphate/aromatic aminotransferase/cobyric acid decarboxylase-like protein